MATELEDRVAGVMAAVLNMDAASIDESTSVETTENWDSLKHMNLVVALEEEFDLEFDDDEIMDMTDFQAITSLVADKTA